MGSERKCEAASIGVRSDSSDVGIYKFRADGRTGNKVQVQLRLSATPCQRPVAEARAENPQSCIPELLFLALNIR